MTIQHRLPNPVNPLWVGLSVVTIAGMVGWYYYDQMQKEKDGESAPDAEVIPPSAWNTDPNAAGVLQPLMEGELYKAVMQGPLEAIESYEVSFIPQEAFDVENVHMRGDPAYSEIEILFRPKLVGGQTTPALIRALSPVPNSFRQLHLEIE